MKASKNTTKSPASRKRVTAKSSKESLEDILKDLVKDIYWAEKHLAKALPKMAKAANDENLREVFTSHLEETENQITRLEKCFELMDMKAVAKKCEAMEGLLKEGSEVIQEHDKGPARDVALIAAAQKVEHYEMSAYGSLRSMANVLGKNQCAQLFESTKDEEYGADIKLSELAEKINQQAAEVEMEGV